jgi:PadR family transcriptional regulator, regulatory protein PadR
MLPKPLLAATFEPLVLALLASGETYGYDIIQRVERISDGRIRWTANRLYPLLHSLENRSLVTARWVHEGPGPGRKYYRLTAKGKMALAQTRQDWLDVSALLSRLWRPGLETT